MGGLCYENRFLHVPVDGGSVPKKHAGLLADLKATGYDGVEIPVFAGTPDDYRRLGDLLDRIGLERTAISAMGDPAMNLIAADLATRRRGIDYMKWAVECTAALGATTLSGPLHSTLGGSPALGRPLSRRSARWPASAPSATTPPGAGVTIGLEALNRFECYLVNTMDALCAHIDEIGHPARQGDVRYLPCQYRGDRPGRRLSAGTAATSSMSISRRMIAACRGAAMCLGQTFAAIRKSGYDGWLTIEAFGRGLKDLAAATKVWRDFAESPEAVYREGFRHIKAGWRKAASATT